MTMFGGLSSGRREQFGKIEGKENCGSAEVPNRESRQWQWLARQEVPAGSPRMWVCGGDEENFCRILSTVTKTFHTRTIILRRRRHLTDSPRMKSKRHPNLGNELYLFCRTLKGPSPSRSTHTSPVAVPRGKDLESHHVHLV